MTDLSLYTGLNIPQRLDTAEKREVYLVNWEQLHINYGDNVEWQKLKHQVLLCPATRDALYAPPSPVRYRKGSRPYLEEKVRAATAGCSTPRETVLALLTYCRDLYKTHDGAQLFYGGTEEELIKKGVNLCEAVSRLMVALCEVAGFPGRIVMHVAGGHIVCEIWFEGRWAYLDPRFGLFYLDGQDNFLSVAEILRDPACLHRQKEWVKNYVSIGQTTYEKREQRNAAVYFSPEEIQCFCPYSLEDAPEYSYEWKSVRRVEQDGLFVINKRYRELSAAIFGTEN